MSSLDPQLLARLACPRCTQSLKNEGQTLKCSACNTVFPLIDEIPFLFAEPEAASGEWRSRIRHAQAQSERSIAEINDALGSEDLISSSRERLTRLRDATQAQQSALMNCLKPFLDTKTEAHVETFLALRTRLPQDQGLNTYFPNIFRDWCWGDGENKDSLAAVSAALPTVKPGANVVVLGAGAGRLAYDLAGAHAQAQFIALDFNPLLMLVADAVNRGETLCFQEFPLAPLEGKDACIERILKRPDTQRDNLSWMIADALRAPLKAASVDLVVTPWLLDIMDARPGVLAARINHWLSNTGSWINFGSMAFRAPALRDCLTRDELIETIQSQGFTEESSSESQIDYMCSPASRHHRRETVSTIRFRKSGSVAAPGQYRALPDWIVTGKSPVPAQENLLQQAAATRIHAFIMSMIDGKRSLQDMAVLMEQQNLMSAAEATEAIRGFLIRMYDDANRYSAFLG